MDYMKELNVAITVCDKEGKILQMNDKSQKRITAILLGRTCWIVTRSLPGRSWCS